MDRAPGSRASSTSRHLLLERVLDPLVVVGVGTAIGLSGNPSHRFPLQVQRTCAPTDRRTAGLGLGLRNLPSPGLSRSLWVLNAKGWGRASISPWALTRDQMSSTARARSLLYTHKHARTHSEPDLCAIPRAGEQPARSLGHIWTRAQRAPTPPVSCTHPRVEPRAHTCALEKRAPPQTARVPHAGKSAHPAPPSFCGLRPRSYRLHAHPPQRTRRFAGHSGAW